MKMHIEIKLCLDATLLLWFRNPGVGLFLQNNFYFIFFGNKTQLDYKTKFVALVYYLNIHYTGLPTQVESENTTENLVCFEAGGFI